MIIAIDETGDFSENSEKIQFFVAAHLGTLGKKRRDKARQFRRWEGRLSSQARNPKGEVKGSRLRERQLEGFLEEVMIAEPSVGLSPVGFIPIKNSMRVLAEHKEYLVRSIREGALKQQEFNNAKGANFAEQMGNWVNALNYQKFSKLWLLSDCIYHSLRQGVGSSAAWGEDQELRDIKYKIDRDFIREPNPISFWKDLLRCSLYQASLSEPMPVLDEWGPDHWFTKKYRKDGRCDFNAIFWKNAKFLSSHESWEIQIADIAGTLLNRVYNQRQYRRLAARLNACCIGRYDVHIREMRDFKPEEEETFKIPNPWLESFLRKRSSEDGHGS